MKSNYESQLRELRFVQNAKINGMYVSKEAQKYIDNIESELKTGERLPVIYERVLIVLKRRAEKHMKTIDIRDGVRFD